MPAPIVALVGATASGKTGLSLDLAQRLGGAGHAEVVNTDAMQIYRGMDIGTAKLARTARRGIDHHLLDVLEVTEPATVARFQGWAREAIADIRGRGRTPVLVGGSALYTRAIVDRFEFPGTDESVRGALEIELALLGTRSLHDRLREVDPVAAAQIVPDNGRRVVRALEVIALTGRPYSSSLPVLEYAEPQSIQIGVDIDRPTLDERISQRVEEMFETGLVAEVEGLVERGLEQGRTASRAIGYRQVVGFLHGEHTLAQAMEQTKAATRRFSRRQDSWFRKDPRIVWVSYDDPNRVEVAMRAIEALTG